MSRYKSKWVPGEANEEFWCEVLKGKTIRDLRFENGKLTDLFLDDGQTVSIITNENAVATLAIKD
jgi:hypothetical protein